MLPFCQQWALARQAFVWMLALAAIDASWSPGLRAAPFAYATDVNGAVAVIDTKTGALVGSPISVGGAVTLAVAIDPAGKFVYVVSAYAHPDFGNGSVSVISTASNMVVATIPVGQQARGAAVSPDGSTLYVTNYDNSTMSVIDTSTRTVRATVNAGTGPAGVAVDPSGNYIYVANTQSVSVIAASSLVVTQKIPISSPLNEAFGVAISSDGRYAYVSEFVSATAGNVLVVSTASRSVIATIPIGGTSYGIAVSKSGARVYATSNGTVKVIDTNTNSVIATIAVGRSARGIALTPDDRSLWVMNGDGTVSVIDTTTNAVVNTINASVTASSFGNFIGPAIAPAGASAVVEFYAASLDHYFMTQSTVEIQVLDTGIIPGWARTGQTFFAFTSGQGGPTTNPVCRYYGLPSAGLDSHFYSADRTECAAVAQRFPTSWQKESDNVFEIALPDLVSGNCAAGSVPIYRLWNNRRDSNHRYTLDLGIRQQMIGRGYISEGYGPLGVAMCAPSSQ